MKKENSHENLLTLNMEGTAKYKVPIFTQSPRNENVPLHKHTYIEFFYVFDGEGIHELNHVEKKLYRGNACLLLFEDIHKFYKTDDGVFLRRDILVDPAFFKEACDFYSSTLYDEIMKKKYNNEFTLSNEQISNFELFAPFLFLSPESDEYKFASKFIMSVLLNALISAKAKKRKNNAPAWLNNLLTRLNLVSNFGYDISSLIKDLPYSDDYIRRQFKKYYKMTMTEYFNDQKINYSYFLLKNTDMTIEKICETIGFSNISHFYKLFKNKHNTTPMNIRNQA